MAQAFSPTEIFKRATAATLRAIAERDEPQIVEAFEQIEIGEPSEADLAEILERVASEYHDVDRETFSSRKEHRRATLQLEHAQKIMAKETDPVVQRLAQEVKQLEAKIKDYQQALEQQAAERKRQRVAGLAKLRAIAHQRQRVPLKLEGVRS